MPIFCQKTSILTKTLCLHVIIFSIFLWKTPSSHAHIWSKKPPFCENDTLLWAKKVNSMHWAHILSKKRPLSQKHNALVTFFSIFHEKPPAVMPIFGQKNVNSVKTTLYYGSKKVNRMPFFSDFSQKINCSHAHIFSKKSQFSKKHTAIMPI